MSEHDDIHREALRETGFWGRAAAGCLFVARDTGRIMIALRSMDVLEGGTWGTWGGAIDPDESPVQAVLREAFEETGYEGRIDVSPLLVFRSGDFRYHNHVAVVEEEFVPDLGWEASDFVWTRFGDWPEPLHPGLAALISDETSMRILSDTCAAASEPTGAPAP